MKATHLPSLTYATEGHNVLVITPEVYPLPSGELLTPERWERIYHNEALVLAQFLQQTFCVKTVEKLKSLL